MKMDPQRIHFHPYGWTIVNEVFLVYTIEFVDEDIYTYNKYSS